MILLKVYEALRKLEKLPGDRRWREDHRDEAKAKLLAWVKRLKFWLENETGSALIAIKTAAVINWFPL